MKVGAEEVEDERNNDIINSDKFIYIRTMVLQFSINVVDNYCNSEKLKNKSYDVIEFDVLDNKHHHER